MNKSAAKIIGWIVSIAVAIIGTFGATSKYQSNTQNNTQNQSNSQSQNISIVVNGEKVELNKDNAQGVYDKIEEENKNLSTELEHYKAYGTEALVSKERDASADRVSLFAYEAVNSDYWEPSSGSLKDSLGNNYSVTLAYIVLKNRSYGEYYTNLQYSKLQFKLAPHESMGQDAAAVVKVYADDVLVFTSKEVTRKSEEQTYTIDLNNAKFIKITCECVRGYDGNILCLDSTLIK